MNRKWGEFEGSAIGAWRLDSLLGVRGNIAFYLTRDSGGEGDRLMALVASGAASAPTVASWRRSRDLPELLLPVHATGSAEIDGTAVEYAVLDLPDDDLGEILAKRKLDEPEARPMFLAVASALQALHRRGLVHGAVTPSNIFLVRDSIRLSVDTLAPAGKSGRERDLRQFGATLVQAMTGRAGAVDQLGVPFREIAIGCQEGASKWTAARIVETLTGRPAAAAPPVRVRWPLLAGTGIGVVALLFYLFFHDARHPAPTNPALPANPAPVRTESPVREAAPKPRAQEPPPASTTAGVAERKRAPKKTGDSWAVIAATYAYFDMAQKHAEIYHRKFPNLQPRAFPPDGQGKHYFIVLGTGLTQEAAERLRQDAIEQGAPHDTYVTKIME